ncbi:hypothetical protein M422DRAFT_274852 [Sphaerobolus stellatus SS14]|uniref:Uncharacterized protein n=1 Tax=Sphaerobolus stellatus (strain SS14) TaxID=990650 RepID=A0A0C9UG23_SPHS4|nr:hypothetical protein M422DRAFT_274852 [Sphaerobolus stellatus SS14]
MPGEVIITDQAFSIFVTFRIGYGSSKYFVTPDRGSTWTSKSIHPDYEYKVGIPSSDGQHLFFTRGGAGFGGAGQGVIVEAYSVKNWQLSKPLTFGFGDGREIHNISLIPFLSIHKPIWCSVKNTIFSSSGNQFQYEYQDTYFAERFISEDNKHLIILGRDDGQLHYWDLTRPTYKPFISVELPAVDVAQKYIHRINGKDTVVRHAIPKQVRNVKFSPGGQIATIIVANNCSVVVLSFLTYNFQLVHSKVFKYNIGSGIVPLQVFIGKDRGVSLIGASPDRGNTSQGFWGLIGTFMKVSGAFEEICAIENYFDSATFRVKMVERNQLDGKDNIELLHRWTITDTSLIQTHGVPLTPSAEVQEYQNKLAILVFMSATSYSHGDPRQRIIPLVITSYPWDPCSKVITFVVRLKYGFCILSMAISPASLTKPYLLRVLYHSEKLLDGDETIEIYRKDDHYILHIDAERNRKGGYSGMPLPSRRTTIIGHYFLPEDAHYDLILVKESASCTMPNGSITWPNPVLVFTASFAAYFPDGYIREGTLLDYGLRLRSEYTMARILM